MELPKPVRKNVDQNVVEFHSKKPKKDSLQAIKSQKKVHKRREEKEIAKDDEPESNEKETTFDFKKAKFDVFKFGIKGFSKEDQESANVQLAIKLGAVPPKNKCVNYKELIKEKNLEREKREQLLQENRQFEAKILASKANKKHRTKYTNNDRKSKINRGQVGLIKGHIGSFSNGVLKLKKHDLKKTMKSSKFNKK